MHTASVGGARYHVNMEKLQILFMIAISYEWSNSVSTLSNTKYQLIEIRKSYTRKRKAVCQYTFNNIDNVREKRSPNWLSRAQYTQITTDAAARLPK